MHGLRIVERVTPVIILVVRVFRIVPIGPALARVVRRRKAVAENDTGVANFVLLLLESGSLVTRI